MCHCQRQPLLVVVQNVSLFALPKLEAARINSSFSDSAVTPEKVFLRLLSLKGPISVVRLAEIVAAVVVRQL